MRAPNLPVSARLWIGQGVIILFCFLAYFIHQAGIGGQLTHPFLYHGIYERLHRIFSITTDIKFRLRGPEKSKSPVVIVEIDDVSLEQLGRWPWDRDVTAFLIQRLLDLDAQVVALDIVFPEKGHYLPVEIEAALRQRRFDKLIEKYDPNRNFVNLVRFNENRVIVPWQSSALCQIPIDRGGHCGERSRVPEDFARFSPFKTKEVDFSNSTLFTALDVTNSFEELYQATKLSGFVNGLRDPDGQNRRAYGVLLAGNRIHPSLPLMAALTALDEEMRVTWDRQGRISHASFTRSGRPVPLSSDGTLGINFRGPQGSFTYVSALDVFLSDSNEGEQNPRRIAAVNAVQSIKGAVVLVGATALALGDIVATPFDAQMPGVEVHANVLEGAMTGNFLRMANDPFGFWGLFFMLIVGGGLFSHILQRLNAIRDFLIFTVVFGVLWWIDVHFLFTRNRNWNTGFVYLELTLLFVFTIIAKYAIEEKKRKFLKDALSKYVSPVVADELVKHPETLALGGKKENITILFCDIRNFTTFSESVDAKVLAEFLNDHMEALTNVIFASNGTLDKYIGDAIMAFWGAPIPIPDHAGRACDSALKMLKAVQENRPRMKQKFGIDIHIGVGLNSGSVSVGNMGSRKSFGYTAVGDAVNLASRLEGATKSYGVECLVSRATLNEIQKSSHTVPKYRSIDTVRVKGKKEAVEIAELLDREVPEGGIQAFQEARKDFLSRKWDSAILKYREANQIFLNHYGKSDGPSTLFISRAEKYKIQAPPGDWDGAWDSTEK